MYRIEGQDQTMRPTDIVSPENNEEIEADTNELLSSLPADMQRIVASEWQSFMSSVRDGLATLASKRGSDHVVTEDDVS